MTIMGKGGAAVLIGAGLAALAAGGEAQAQVRGNPAYRAYLMSVCPTATGELANLCAVSRGGQISSDSQSSLTPNQAAVAGTNSLARAQALAATTEQRLEVVREEEGETPAAAPGGWSVFASVQGEWSEQDRPDFANERAYDADAVRFTAGADVRLASGLVLGGSIAYGDYSSDFDPNPTGNNFTPQADAGGIDSQDLTFTLYGSYTLSERMWVDGSVGVGFTDYDFRRNASFQESNRVVPQVNVQARGSSDGREYHAAVGAGWDLSSGPASFGPYVRLRYIRSKIDSYTETDAANSGLALDVSAARATSFTSVVGGRASWAISTSWGVVVPQARLEWEHEFKDDSRISTTRFALAPTAPAFQVASDAPDRDYFNAGVGVLVVLPNGWMPFVDYEGLLGYSDFDRHRLTVGLRVEF
jgi:outer membrane autotransporter protein